MYSNAELFGMAAKQPKEVFLGNVTLSISDDFEGHLDLDAETVRLSHLWDGFPHERAGNGQGLRTQSDRFCKAGGHPASHCAGLVRREACVPCVSPLFVGRALRIDLRKMLWKN